MKEIKVKLYAFDELSPEAQEKAIRAKEEIINDEFTHTLSEITKTGQNTNNIF